MHPGERILHETLRQRFKLMQAAKKKMAKQFAPALASPRFAEVVSEYCDHRRGTVFPVSCA